VRVRQGGKQVRYAPGMRRYVVVPGDYFAHVFPECTNGFAMGTPCKRAFSNHLSEVW
jgi:hypothetical protein